jgi:hypothetical protein
VAEEEPAQAVAGPGQIGDHLPPDAAQVPHALLLPGGDGDGRELAGAVQPGQAAGVALVGLHLVAFAPGHERGRHHLAAHAEGHEQAVELVAGGPRLVAGPQPGGVAEAGDQAADRLLVVEDLVNLGVVAVGREDRDGDRVLRHVHAEVREPPMRQTGHGRLLSVCRLHSPKGA